MQDLNLMSYFLGIISTVVGVIFTSFIKEFFAKREKGLEKDQKVYKELIDKLPKASPTIQFLKTPQYLGNIDHNIIDRLEDLIIYYDSEKPRFNDSEVERQRSKFETSLCEFFDYFIANRKVANQEQYTVLPHNERDDFTSESTQTKQTIERLEKLGTELYNDYWALITIARKNLKV